MRRWSARRWVVVLAVLERWSFLLVSALFGAGALVVLTVQPLAQNADGLIQTLFSLQKLTLFFWGQDRFANLLPLLAAPVRDPATNAALQVTLRIVLGLLAPLPFCVFLLGHPRPAWQATLAASALFLALAPQRFIHEALIEASPYGTSFALAGLALLLLRRAGKGQSGTGRQILRAGGLLLTGMACLVNVSLLLTFGPLVVGEALLFGSALAMEFGLAALLATGGAVAAMATVQTGVPTDRGFAETTVGLVYLVRQMLGKTGAFPFAAVAAWGAAVVLLRAGGCRMRARNLLGHGALLAATLVFGFLAISLSSWVVLNFVHPRYLVPIFVLVAALGGSVLLNVLHATLREPARTPVVLVVCACLLAAAERRHPPEGAAVHGIVDPARLPAANAVAAVVFEHGLDGIAGDYWEVWPAVFQAEQLMHDAGQPAGRVFGVAYRGEVRQAAFAARLLQEGRLRIACIGGDAGWCNALLRGTMALPPADMGSVGPPLPLTDGRVLTVFTIERPPASPFAGSPWPGEGGSQHGVQDDPSAR